MTRQWLTQASGTAPSAPPDARRFRVSRIDPPAPLRYLAAAGAFPCG